MRSGMTEKIAIDQECYYVSEEGPAAVPPGHMQYNWQKPGAFALFTPFSQEHPKTRRIRRGWYAHLPPDNTAAGVPPNIAVYR
jgi:hypothetical protein